MFNTTGNVWSDEVPDTYVDENEETPEEYE